jgi:oligopeptide/dipeptide ABC transporter ATP-binding protein
MTSPEGAAPLIRTIDLVKHFAQRQGVVHAVDGVSLAVARGETLGVVGESGCGKSTLGRTMLRLYDVTAGQIEFEGRPIAGLGHRELRPLRRHMQVIFQDPFASLNPRNTIARTLLEPFIVHGIGGAGERMAWAEELLRRVGLGPEHLARFPHEFSGGQRQRIAIARAIALRPKLIVCDEPVSSLDVSIQAQVMNLLLDLKRELGLSYVFITHDLSVLGHIADRVAVMYLGKVVEIAERTALWRSPLHPYTRVLLSSVPTPDPARRHLLAAAALSGAPPSATDPPAGCRFHTRCPHAIDRCRKEEPALRSVRAAHGVACHLAEVAGDVAAGASPTQPMEA